MNSCNFFLSVFEEMKSCIYRVETANAGMGLKRFWHHLFILLLEETVRFTTKRICKIHFLTRLGNHDPMFTLHIAGLRVDNSESVNIKSWNMIWREWTEVPNIEQRDTIDSLLQSKINHFYTFFLTTPNLSTATDNIRSPKTMSSVTFSRRLVKFSSSLSGSPPSSG